MSSSTLCTSRLSSPPGIRRHHSRSLLLCLAALMLVAMVRIDPAAAQDGPAEGEPQQSEFDQLVLAGAEAYEERDYARALDLFEQAYALEPVPDLLYNMGIIADRMGDFDRSLGYLNRFVVSPDIDLDARRDALSRIEQLQQLKALQEPGKPDPVVEPRPEPEVRLPDPRPELPPEPPRGPNYLGPGILMGVGLVTLAGGGITGGLALAEHSNFEDATDLDKRRDAADTGKALALASDILLPTGAALTVAGIIWLAVEATSDSDGAVADSTRVLMAPSVSAEGPALNLRVDF